MRRDRSAIRNTSPKENPSGFLAVRSGQRATRPCDCMSETDPGDGLGRMPARKNVAATRPDPDKGQKKRPASASLIWNPVSIEDRQRVHAQCLGSLIRNTREGVIVRDHTFFAPGEIQISRLRRTRAQACPQPPLPFTRNFSEPTQKPRYTRKAPSPCSP